MTLESKIESDATEKAEARGWFEFKIMRASKRGVPDRFFAKLYPSGRQRTVFIEFKQPGKEPTRQQEHRHNQMRAAGLEVHWCDTWEDALEILT